MTVPQDEAIRCNVCDQPIQHELVCEDCLQERGFITSETAAARAETAHGLVRLATESAEKWERRAKQNGIDADAAERALQALRGRLAHLRDNWERRREAGDLVAGDDRQLTVKVAANGWALAIRDLDAALMD